MQHVHFPGFEILKKLGQGGMGAVYKVREIQTSRIFAIKTVLSTKKDPRSYQRFLREAQAYAAVQHPNIVRIYRIEPNNDRPFMVMQYIDGLPLGDYLKNKLSFDQKLCLFKDIATAVYVLHKHNIIHRDLKPANIMIDNYANPYIMDFGLVKAIDNKHKGLTKKGDILGSPKYMSPEQIGGYKLDARSDIYALGVCFYEMLTRKQLVEGDSIVSIMFEISHGTITYPRKIDKNIPPALEAICVKCLEKQTKNRYANIQHLLNDINRYQNGEKTKAKEVNLWYNINKTIEKYATEATIFCVFILCILGIWASWSTQHQFSLQNLRDFSKKEAMETLDKERHKYAGKDIAIQVRYLHSLGNYKEALDIINNAPYDNVLQILKGKTFYKMHEYTKALDIYNSISSNNIENPEFKEYLTLQILKAELALKQDFIPMEKFCTNALQPSIQAEAHHHLGTKYLKYFEDHFYHLDFYKDSGSEYAEKAYSHFIQAQKKYIQQNKDIALEIARCLLYKSQAKQNAHHLITEAKSYIPETLDSDYDSRRQLRFHYTQALYQQLHGQTLLRKDTNAKQSLHEAVRQYSLAIEIDSSDAQLYIQRARCYRLLQEYSLSEKDYLQVIDLEPQNFFAAYALINNLFADTPIQSKQPTFRLLQKIAFKAFMLSDNDLLAKHKEQLYKSSYFSKTQPYNDKQVQKFIEKIEEFEKIDKVSLREKLQSLVINSLVYLSKFEQVYDDLQKKRDLLKKGTMLDKTLAKAQDKIIIHGHINMLIDIYLRKNQRINKVNNLTRTTKTLIRIVEDKSILQQYPTHTAIIKFIVLKALVDIGSPYTVQFIEKKIQYAHLHQQLSQDQAESVALCMTLFYSNYWPYDFSQGLSSYQTVVENDIKVLSAALNNSSEIVRCLALNTMPIEYKKILVHVLNSGTTIEKLYAAKQLWIHGHNSGGKYLSEFVATPQEERLLAFAYEKLWLPYNTRGTRVSILQQNQMRKFCETIVPQMVTTLEKCKPHLKNTLLTNLAVFPSTCDDSIIEHVSSPMTNPYVCLRIISRLGIRKDISIIKKIVSNTSIPLVFRLIATASAIDNSKNYAQMFNILSILQNSKEPIAQNLVLIYSLMYGRSLLKDNSFLSNIFAKNAYKNLQNKDPQKQVVALVALYGEKIAPQHLNKLKPLIASKSQKIQRYAAMNLGVQLVHLKNRDHYVQQICGQNIHKQNVREGIILGYQRLFYRPLDSRKIIDYLFAQTTLTNFHIHFEHEQRLYAALKITKPEEVQKRWSYIHKWSKDISPQVQQQVIFWNGLLQSKTGQHSKAIAAFESLTNDLHRSYWLAKAYYEADKKHESIEQLQNCLEISPWDMPSMRLQHFLLVKASVDGTKLSANPMHPSFLYAPEEYRFEAAYFAHKRRKNKGIKHHKKILFAEETRTLLENLPFVRLSALTLRSRALIYLDQPQLSGRKNDLQYTKQQQKLAHDYILYKNQFFHIPLARIKDLKKLYELFTEKEKEQFFTK